MPRYFVLAALALSGCSQTSLCSSEVKQVARDLNSDRYAATEVRNCGATADYATVVRVGRASEGRSEAEEVFVADPDHGLATPGGGGAVWTSVVWTSPGQLFIAYASKARVFKQQPAAKGARVRYRASDPLFSPLVS